MQPRATDSKLETAKLEDNVVADLDFFGSSDIKEPAQNTKADGDDGPKNKRRKLGMCSADPGQQLIYSRNA